MTESDSEPRSPTAVTIFGRTYHLRGGGEADYLRHLAEVVDAKMRDVAGATGTADTLKVAILAALNLADDAHHGRGHEGRGWTGEQRDRVRKMIETIDGVLAD